MGYFSDAKDQDIEVVAMTLLKLIDLFTENPNSNEIEMIIKNIESIIEVFSEKVDLFTTKQKAIDFKKLLKNPKKATAEAGKFKDLVIKEIKKARFKKVFPEQARIIKANAQDIDYYCACCVWMGFEKAERV